ncbi:MAG: leucine-rich repeat domain-containing protein, partial [Saprospiraceae bacterium]
ISNLKKLQELSLIGLGLDEIPAEVWALKNLRMLFCSGNKLKQLPIKELMGLKHLTLLFIANNKLESIPRDILKMKNLHNIEWNNNPLDKDSISFLSEFYARAF